jgi:hypothetical protein
MVCYALTSNGRPSFRAFPSPPAAVSCELPRSIASVKINDRAEESRKSLSPIIFHVLFGADVRATASPYSVLIARVQGVDLLKYSRDGA